MNNASDPSLILGTRGSPLARAQAALAAQALRRVAPDAAIREQILFTEGDRVQDRALRDIGGKALWTRELDRALLDGDIHVAVHSMKDVETALAPGIRLAAMLPRADPADRLIGADTIAALPPGALVGTSSPRRAAQLLHRRPDLRVATLRGNVDTRLSRVAEGAIAATFLAAAGLDRLGRSAGVALPLADWLPAVGQGAVGLACRDDDESTLKLLAAIDDAPTHRAVAAERGLLEGLGGSCHTAVAVHATHVGGRLHLRAELYSPDGREMLAEAADIATPDGRDAARALGLALAEKLLARATPAIRASLA